MDSEHWFDALNKALVRDAPRRTMLRAAAVATSLALGVPLEARPKKGKKRKVGKKKRKKDRPNSPPPSTQCLSSLIKALWSRALLQNFKTKMVH